MLIDSLRYIRPLNNEYEFLILGNNFERSEKINGFNFNFRKFTQNKEEQIYYHSASELTVSPSRGELFRSLLLKHYYAKIQLFPLTLEE